MAHRLPEFKGYTVDRRLREFRRMVFAEMPEFIPFQSEKGRELTAEMRKRPCRFCHHQKGRDEHKASGNEDCRCSCNH
ncbi:MAG: hypothetical protein ABSB56_00015 [Nitrososphaerales archaeon]|jgi:hypothetical protein